MGYYYSVELVVAKNMYKPPHYSLLTKKHMLFVVLILTEAKCSKCNWKKTPQTYGNLNKY